MDAIWFGTLPHSMPAVGRVAVFNYSGLWHVAYILQLSDDGFWVYEWNFHKCEKGTRFVYWNDPSIAMFWAPEV